MSGPRFSQDENGFLHAKREQTTKGGSLLTPFRPPEDDSKNGRSAKTRANGGPERSLPDLESQSLTEIEARTIEIFVAAARALRFPQSVGEIYGLLFVTPRSISFEHILRKLHMSQGSVSQGLKFLRGLGAVKRIYVPTDRRNHYCAQTELWTLAAGILRDRLDMGCCLEGGTIPELMRLAGDLPGGDRLDIEARLKLLAEWSNQAQALLPVVIRHLGQHPATGV